MCFEDMEGVRWDVVGLMLEFGVGVYSVSWAHAQVWDRLGLCGLIEMFVRGRVVRYGHLGIFGENIAKVMEHEPDC